MDKTKLQLVARRALREAQEKFQAALSDPANADEDIEITEMRLMLAALALAAVLK